MRSLHFKLILIFLAVSLAGTLLAAVLIRQHTEQAFDRLLREQGQATFVRDVQAYYTAVGSLNGIERLIRAQLSHGGPGQGAQSHMRPFALADANGRVVVPGGNWRRGAALTQRELAGGLAVTVEGETVGTILLLNQQPQRNALEQGYVAGINRALFLGALGATALAVVLAAVLAHALTRPLAEVAAASHAIAHGALGQQVPVRTRDELGELASAFNTMSAALARATEQRRQMTADIAHDLRTPLTVLGGYLEAMEEGTLAATPERLAILQQEVGGLIRLVEDLRILSLVDAGELPLQLQQTDVAELLAQVHHAYAPQAASQDVELRLQVTSEYPPAQLDPERMRQVLGNLVSNALRHTKAGGTVTLEAAPGEGHELLLKVGDTGSGIAAEDLPYIFNRFYRGEKARSEAAGASGLGLAIARSLVETHGGTISVDSGAGEGTTFVIRLPWE